MGLDVAVDLMVPVDQGVFPELGGTDAEGDLRFDAPGEVRAALAALGLLRRQATEHMRTRQAPGMGRGYGPRQA